MCSEATPGSASNVKTGCLSSRCQSSYDSILTCSAQWRVKFVQIILAQVQGINCRAAADTSKHVSTGEAQQGSRNRLLTAATGGFSTAEARHRGEGGNQAYVLLGSFESFASFCGAASSLQRRISPFNQMAPSTCLRRSLNVTLWCTSYVSL